LEWGKTFKRLSEIYDSPFQHRSSDEPVKVAVLDTGVDRNHPDFQHPRSKPKKGGIIRPVRGEEEQIKRIKASQNFCDHRKDVEDVTDIDGHGNLTHVVGIILRLAPAADLYIARVCEGDESYGRSSIAPKTNVSKEKLKQSVDAKKVHPSGVERVILHFFPPLKKNPSHYCADF
jgi:subtilisin family serine protease